MTSSVADYEGQNLPLDPPGTPQIQQVRPAVQRPAGARKTLALPHNTLLEVGVKRLVWTEQPRGTWEVEARITAEPDNNATTTANLDRMYASAKARIEAWIEQLEQEDTPDA